MALVVVAVSAAGLLGLGLVASLGYQLYRYVTRKRAAAKVAPYESENHGEEKGRDDSPSTPLLQETEKKQAAPSTNIGSGELLRRKNIPHQQQSSESRPAPVQPAMVIKTPPPIAPKPKSPARVHANKDSPATPTFATPIAPKPSPNAVQVMPLGLAAQAAAMARKRDEASPEDNENAPQENEIIPKPAVNGIISKPVVNGVGAPKKNRQFEEPVSFEEPTQAPVLKTPPRNKGPTNRRPPSRR